MKKALLTVLAYILWLASAALTLWALLILRVPLLIQLPGEVLKINPWRLAAIDKFGTVILGVLWLIFIVITESHFRRLPKRDLSVKSIVKIFIVEAFLLGAAYGASWWLSIY